MKKCFILVAAAFVLVFALSAFAVNPLMISRGQAVYVPAAWMEITSTGQLYSSRLVIRNIDPNNYILIYSVQFRGVDGSIVKNLFDGNDCDGNPTVTSLYLGPFQSTSFTITTGCIPRYPQAETRRPGWIVHWYSASGKTMVAPSIGATIYSQTPTSIFGHTGTPYYIIQSDYSVAGTVFWDLK